MKRILFDSRANFQFILSKIQKQYEENEKYGVLPVSIFHNKIDYERNRTIRRKDLLYKYFVKEKHYDISFIEEIENSYSPTTFWNIALSDRYLKTKSKTTILKTIFKYLIAWDRLIIKYNPEIVISEPITGLWNFCLLVMCRKHNIRYLAFASTKTTNKYYFSNNLFAKFNQFEDYYNSLIPLKLNEVAKNEVKNFLVKFRKERTVAEYVKKTMKSPSVSYFINIFSLLKGLMRDFNRIFNRKYDYTLGYSLYDYYYNIKRFIKILIIKLLRPFDDEDKEDNYILFPLHFQPEATTDIWAPFFSNQLQVIEFLSRSIPVTYKLYVKEHKAIFGSKKINFYSKVKEFQNVKLIKPSSNIHELIIKSKAVAVITGTSGLEAIFYNKPVIIFGNVFYDFYPYIYKVENLDNLSTLIKKAINIEISEGDDRRIKFIYSYFLSGYSPSIFKSNFSDFDIESYINHINNEINY